MPSPLSQREINECASVLKDGAMFRRVSEPNLKALAKQMGRAIFHRGDVILEEGKPSNALHVLADGHVVRTRKHPEDPTRERQVTDPVPYKNAAGRIINSLRLVDSDPIHASARCEADVCKTYVLTRNQLEKSLATNPDFAKQVVASLCLEVRETSAMVNMTPLLEQKDRTLNFQAFTAAAAIESFYRSALNSMINYNLTGVKGALFPNMHIQLPVRVAYINGFKGLRSFFDNQVNPNDYTESISPQYVRFGVAVAPGVIMTPISSILEASNAGHLNPESMATRWMRGLLPRAAREVIFGVGLNQLSDYFEERFSNHTESTALANAAGSLSAGVVAGYLSHVPHNLSTFKLLDPAKSYGQHFHRFVNLSVPQGGFVDSMVAPFGHTARCVAAVIFPKGCLVRTAQIVGSFMILNGMIRLVAHQQSIWEQQNNNSSSSANLFAPAPQLLASGNEGSA